MAKFHYTGSTGPDQTKSADYVGDPGLLGSGPVGSRRACVVKFSYSGLCSRCVDTAVRKHPVFTERIHGRVNG